MEESPILVDGESAGLAMSEVLGLQALPEAAGATAEGAWTGAGSFISVYSDCRGAWSVTCIPLR